MKNSNNICIKGAKEHNLNGSNGDVLFRDPLQSIGGQAAYCEYPPVFAEHALIRCPNGAQLSGQQTKAGRILNPLI